MNPYIYTKEATDNGESLLSLCCGIGLELNHLNTQDVTAVDIYQGYLNEVKGRCPQARTICSPAVDYITAQPDNSVDVISFLDGVEHMNKKDGLKCLKECKRVARKQVLVFTPESEQPDGYLKNEPHNAWGIPGADEYQTHKSGWTLKELEKLGYKLILATNDISQHGEPYRALMLSYKP